MGARRGGHAAVDGGSGGAHGVATSPPEGRVFPAGPGRSGQRLPAPAQLLGVLRQPSAPDRLVQRVQGGVHVVDVQLQRAGRVQPQLPSEQQAGAAEPGSEAVPATFAAAAAHRHQRFRGLPHRATPAPEAAVRVQGQARILVAPHAAPEARQRDHPPLPQGGAQGITSSSDTF